MCQDFKRMGNVLFGSGFFSFTGIILVAIDLVFFLMSCWLALGVARLGDGLAVSFCSGMRRSWFLFRSSPWF
jgi:hypothetical protein